MSRRSPLPVHKTGCCGLHSIKKIRQLWDQVKGFSNDVKCTHSDLFIGLLSVRIELLTAINTYSLVSLSLLFPAVQGSSQVTRKNKIHLDVHMLSIHSGICSLWVHAPNSQTFDHMWRSVSPQIYIIITLKCFHLLLWDICLNHLSPSAISVRLTHLFLRQQYTQFVKN